MGNIEDMVIRGVYWLAVVLPCLTVHEFAHAYSAMKLGDPTAERQGRVTLNPIPHIDPIGTILMPIFIHIGWAKPVPVNPHNFRNPRRDDIIVSAAGPGSNIALALAVGLALRVVRIVAPGVMPMIAFEFFVSLTMLSLALAFFNLIPLGPLDGHHIAENLLPYPYAQQYRRFNQYGMLVLLGLIFLPDMLGLPNPLGVFIFSPAMFLAHLIIGLPF